MLNRPPLCEAWMRVLSGRICTSRSAFDRLEAGCGKSSQGASELVTVRAWSVLGIVAAVGGFALLLVTLPKVQESQTVLRQLAIAIDPAAAKEAVQDTGGFIAILGKISGT